ncbi:hypothetical protein BDR26DRAFT_905823 [Obelidium mucronatum]|nr:hypothetical protein BDR26DRAFT_905823 [Obelidium mucronatum]
MSQTTKPHRHHKALQDAASYIRQLFCESSYWTQVKTINGIRISMKPAVQPIRDLQSASTTAAETSLLPTFRGDGVIKDITVQEVASVLRGFGARKLWDPRFERGKLLETLSDTENLVLSSQKGNLIVRSRDFVTANAYLGGAIVEIGRHAGMCVKAEQIRSKTILTGIVGSNTACVLQLHISLMDGKEGTLVVKPYSDLQQRFSAVIVGATKGPVFVMNGERISEDVSSPVDSAIGLDNVVDSNQDLAKGSRPPALIDMALEIVDSTWETMIEMTANLVLSSYVSISSLLYGTTNLRATSISHQKSRYEQLDEDRIFEMVLEHVLNESDAF